MAVLFRLNHSTSEPGNGEELTACGNNPPAVSFDCSGHLRLPLGWLGSRGPALSQPVLSCRSSLFSPAKTFEIGLAQAQYTSPSIADFDAQDNAPAI